MRPIVNAWSIPKCLKWTVECLSTPAEVLSEDVGHYSEMEHGHGHANQKRLKPVLWATYWAKTRTSSSRENSEMRGTGCRAAGHEDERYYA
jgi:hypothetical protein